MRFASATEPVAFEASANATTRVRSLELPLEVVVVDRQLVGRRRDAHLEPLVGRELDPRRDAAVVVELRRQDLVARARSRAPAARESAKSSVVMFIPNEISSGDAAEEAAGVRPSRARGSPRPRGPVAYGAPRLPDASRSAFAIACADLVRHLRAAGRVEEREARSAATRTARARLDRRTFVAVMLSPRRMRLSTAGSMFPPETMQTTFRAPSSAPPSSGGATASAPAPSAITRARSAIRRTAAADLVERHRERAVEQLRRVLPDARDQLAAAGAVDERRRVLDRRRRRPRASVAAAGAPVSGSAAKKLHLGPRRP